MKLACLQLLKSFFPLPFIPNHINKPRISKPMYSGLYSPDQHFTNWFLIQRISDLTCRSCFKEVIVPGTEAGPLVFNRISIITKAAFYTKYPTTYLVKNNCRTMFYTVVVISQQKLLP